MDTTIPVTGLDELEKHIDDLIRDPAATPLNPRLFDHVELQLTESNIPPLIGRFLPKLTALLKTYTQGDPAAIVSLTIKFLSPIPFAQVLSLADQESLLQALDHRAAPAANILAMTILHKAAKSASDISLLSQMTPVLAQLITTWLVAPQVEVGQKGIKVLGDLLASDREGTLWRLLFADGSSELYTLLLGLLSGRHEQIAGNQRQLSLAHGRILQLLPRIAAYNFHYLSQSSTPAPTVVHHTNGYSANGDSADATLAHHPPRQGEGLLQFAALHMIDDTDELMRLNLIDFYETFASLMRLTESPPEKTVAIQAMLAEAVARYTDVKEALQTLPERTVPEEADDLRNWLRDMLPASTVVALR